MFSRRWTQIATATREAFARRAVREILSACRAEVPRTIEAEPQTCLATDAVLPRGRAGARAQGKDE